MGTPTYCQVAKDVVSEVQNVGALPPSETSEVVHVALEVDASRFKPIDPHPCGGHSHRVQHPEWSGDKTVGDGLHCLLAIQTRG